MRRPWNERRGRLLLRAAGGSALLLLAGCASLPPPAPGASRPEAEAAGDVTAPRGWIDAEETAALLESLPEESADEIEADLIRMGLLGAEPEAGRQADEEPPPRREAPPPLAGGAESRLHGGDGGPGSTTLLEGRAGPLAGCLRLAGAQGEERIGGWLTAGGPSGGVHLGGMGLQHGLGLLAAAPGRRRSASAGTSLLPPAPGLRAVARAGAEAACGGVAILGAAGSWSALAGAGRVAAAEGRGPGASWVRLANAGARGSAALLLQRVGEARGASVAAGMEAGAACLVAEGAGWRSEDGGVAPAWAAAGRLGLGRWRLEAQVAAGGGGQGPPLGQRPAALPGWQGSGWALGARGPLAEKLKARVLLVGGRSRKPGSDDPASVTTAALEGVCLARLRPDLEAEARVRVSERLTAARGDAAPWQPPGVIGRERRTTLAARACWSRADLKVTAGCRSLTLQDEEAGVDPSPARRRTLAGVHANWDRRGWRLRGSWEWAWGQDVDLVSVCQPLGGIALPRHWGRWDAEGAFGLERRAARWSAGVGAAVRLPAEAAERPATQIFLRSRLAW